MAARAKRKILTSAFYGVALLALASALVFCLLMMHTINRRMNESATSNLLNTTRVIADTLEGLFEKDIDSLKVVGTLYLGNGPPEPEQLLACREAMDLDWIGVVDARGNGTDCFGNQYEISNYPETASWNLREPGYSDAYIGILSGRAQITLWTPIYRDGEYLGAVLGNVILSQYYSANVFTFYDGEGRTYLFYGDDGTWIMKSLGTDGTATRQADIYSLLAASGNYAKDIRAFREAVQAGYTGTAVLKFNGKLSYLCFLPLPGSPGWYVTTVIAKDELLRESSEVQRMIRWVLAILCVTLASATAVIAAWLIRKTKTEELHYREALFANLSSNLDSVFLIHEKGGRKAAFVSDNITRLLGLGREWIGEDAGRLFDWCKIPEDDPQRAAFLEGTLGGPSVREVRVENELGEYARTIRLELIPTELGQEIAVLTDITKDKDIQRSLVEAMERVEAAGNAKNDFLSAMSHDLRTPLNGIVGMTAIAAAHLGDKNRVADCLAKISDSTAHLMSLINEVLDMSQIESGRLELANEAFNLAELLQDVLSVNYPGIQQKNHHVKVRIHLMEHEDVIGDPVRLTRVATNLISNAIKYTPPGGTIRLTLREKPPVLQGCGCYELSVEDNGIGMSPEFQTKLFEPFEREEDVRLSRTQGTGLGLSIVKNFVDLMMGSIQVESEKGRGTTFRVTVNLRLDEREKGENRQLAGLPVLVVDDDLSACEAVTDILRGIGMRGEWVDSGADLSGMRFVGNLSRAALYQSTYDGKVFSVPLSFTGFGFAWNLDLLEKHGLSVPENREEFLEVCDRLKNIGVLPYGANKGFALTVPAMCVGLSELYGSPDQAERIAALNDGVPISRYLRSGYEFLALMIEKGYLDPRQALETTPRAGDVALFLAGKCAFICVSLGDLSKAGKAPFRTELTGLPVLAQGGLAVYGADKRLCVNPESKHLATALQFVEMVGSVEALEKSAELDKVMSSAKESDPAEFPAEEKLVALLRQPGQIPNQDFSLHFNTWESIRDVAQELCGGSGVDRACAMLDAKQQADLEVYAEK